MTDDFGVRALIRFNSEVGERHWADDADLWRMKVNGKDVTARFVVVAAGPFPEPKPAELPGLDDFTGTILKSASWDQSVDLAGKRVAIIGTNSPRTTTSGCKRPAVSSSYLQTFNRNNVDLITDPIETITPTGICTCGGAQRDIEVLATGLRLFYDPQIYRDTPVTGRDGFDLGDFYAHQLPESYRGIPSPAAALFAGVWAVRGGPVAPGTAWWIPAGAHISRVIVEA
nr:hypothetical protein [Mycobacteroides abscessus]